MLLNLSTLHYQYHISSASQLLRLHIRLEGKEGVTHSLTAIFKSALHIRKNLLLAILCPNNYYMNEPKHERYTIIRKETMAIKHQLVPLNRAERQSHFTSTVIYILK